MPQREAADEHADFPHGRAGVDSADDYLLDLHSAAGHNHRVAALSAGLIAASAFAIYGIAYGVAAVRRALWFHPMSIAGAGLFIGGRFRLISLFAGVPS